MAVRRTARARLTAALAAAMLPLACFAATAPERPLAVGDRLPALRGEYLTGRAAALPEDSSGSASLLLLGFTYQSRFSVEPWAKRFRAAYGGREGVTFYEVPMIGGAAVLGKWFINSGMRGGTPVADREHVITVYGGTGAWKQRVGYARPDAAYLILLDKSERVAWMYVGDVNDAAFESLSTAMGNLLTTH